MGLFRRLLGLDDGRPGPYEELNRSLETTSVLYGAPHDPELWRRAEETMGHDLAGVQNEYNRLLFKKHRR